MLTIIGGIYGQRRLLTPPGVDTRPTAAMVRAAVFNICQNSLEGARCLDLCAGSGAIGLEALSRGATAACLVEKGNQAYRCLQANVQALGVQEYCRILRKDALAALEFCRQNGECFDFIYIDPPYAHTHMWQGQSLPLNIALLYAVDKAALLAPGGWLFVETATPAPTWLPLQQLQHYTTRRYGSTTLLAFHQ